MVSFTQVLKKTGTFAVHLKFSFVWIWVVFFFVQLSEFGLTLPEVERVLESPQSGAVTVAGGCWCLRHMNVQPPKRKCWEKETDSLKSSEMKSWLNHIFELSKALWLNYLHDIHLFKYLQLFCESQGPSPCWTFVPTTTWASRVILLWCRQALRRFWKNRITHTMKYDKIPGGKECQICRSD